MESFEHNRNFVKPSAPSGDEWIGIPLDQLQFFQLRKVTVNQLLTKSIHVRGHVGFIALPGSDTDFSGGVSMRVTISWRQGSAEAPAKTRSHRSMTFLPFVCSSFIR